MARWRLVFVCLAAAGLGVAGLLALFGAGSVAAAGEETVIFCRAPEQPIPDGDPAGISDTLVISSELSVLALEISVTVRSEWAGDLALTIGRDGEGPEVTLLERLDAGVTFPAGCGAGRVSAWFSGEPGAPPACTPAIVGTLPPAQPLALLAGQPLSGSWRLRAADQAAGKAAVLESWCLRAQAAPAPRLAVTPEAASAWVAPGQTATTAVTLTNQGGAPWQWGAAPPAAASALLLVEGFEGAGALPAGWTLQPQVVTRTWQTTSFGSHQGGRALLAPPSDQPQDEWLISPPLWLARGWLTFWSWNRQSPCRLSDACDLEAWLLAEDGTVTLLGVADEAWRDEEAWTAHSYELTGLLPAYGPVRVALRFHGTGGSTVVLVDDVQISGQLAPVGCRAPPPTWLSASPLSEALAPGESAPLALVLDATGLVTGTYSGSLCLAGDDPLKPLHSIPVTLNVDHCTDLAGETLQLSVTPGAGGAAELGWQPPPVPASYLLARGQAPYEETPWLSLPEGSAGAIDPEPGAAAFYRLQAIGCGGAVTAASNRVGWLVYEAAYAGAGGSWWRSLSLALDAGAGLDEASELAQAVAGASRVLRWDAAAQAFAGYTTGVPASDFTLAPGDPLLVETGGVSDAAFTLTGDVAAAGAVSFVLAGGAPCRWNHLSLPLELGNVTNAQELAESIGGANGLAAEQLLAWDAAAQAFAYWAPAHDGGTAGLGDNFPVRIGGDYFVCMREEVRWP